MAKVWFVTGSSRGLGRAIVEEALKSGAHVIATARNLESLNHLAEKFSTSNFLPLTLDVTCETDVQKAIEIGNAKFGRIDVVVNNAGYANLAAIEDINTDDFRTQMDTNFMGVVYTTKAVLPILRQQRSGHIFQVSSIGGRVGTPGLCAYQSAKWAVGGFSTILAQEMAPFGVKVTILEPGAMKTDWAGPSMKIPTISKPYEPTVGSVAEMLRNWSSKELMIPEKVAQMMIKLAGADVAPVRLLIGAEAVDYATQAAQALAESDAKWEKLSVSVI
ncbi:hypothetical protein NQ176_g1117 [Zarea fungicola]|uniref:Uncharacterized protein n=1 Tax=Zarea fungicola TaxID=93591 RepID=A0ACC1NWH9_9HYPO|nr:hypothetical protein NQ176_g1117 [Lecanicillium fungicola]